VGATLRGASGMKTQGVRGVAGRAAGERRFFAWQETAREENCPDCHLDSIQNGPGIAAQPQDAPICSLWGWTNSDLAFGATPPTGG